MISVDSVVVEFAYLFMPLEPGASLDFSPLALAAVAIWMSAGRGSVDGAEMDAADYHRLTCGSFGR